MSLSDIFGAMHCCSNPSVGEGAAEEVVVADLITETAFDSAASNAALVLPLSKACLLGRGVSRGSPVEDFTKTTAASKGELTSDGEDEGQEDAEDPCSPAHRLVQAARPSQQRTAMLLDDDNSSPFSAMSRTPDHQPNGHSPTHSQATPSPAHRERKAKRSIFARKRAGSMESMRGIMASFSRALSSTLSHFTHHHAHHHEEEIPAIAIPEGKAALITESLVGVTVAQLQADILAEDGGCFMRMLTETLNCRDFAVMAWRAHSTGAHIGSMTYVMPAPKDIPDAIKKLITVPETVVGTSKTWFTVSESEEKLVILQRGSSEGVMYSDRFHIEYIYEFVVDPQAGGLTVRCWADTVWSKPLPWTHGFLTRTLEKKVKTETAAKFNIFLRILQESTSN